MEGFVPTMYQYYISNVTVIYAYILLLLYLFVYEYKAILWILNLFQSHMKYMLYTGKHQFKE